MNGSHWIMLGIGLIVGGAVGYTVAKKEVSKRLWEEYYSEEKERKGEQTTEEIETAAREAVKEYRVESGDNIDRYKPDISSPDLVAERLDTSKVSKKKGITEELGPYLINMEDCGEDMAQVLMFWWPQTEVATDESDAAVDDVDELVGIDNCRKIVESGAEIGYVRNEKYSTDFEVHIRYIEPD